MKAGDSGFTLIELSIVLVIIGLVVGGVFVGKDLIAAAQLRQSAGQYEKYRSAVNAFRTKYNAVPGDLTASDATSLGILPARNPLADYHGNGMIETGSGGFPNEASGEVTTFWQDLSSAKLVDGSFNSVINDGVDELQFSSDVSKFLPASKISGVYWAAASYGGKNYFYLGGLASTGLSIILVESIFIGEAYADGGMFTDFPLGLSPLQASSIDTKLDDGQPLTGNVTVTRAAFFQPVVVTDTYPCIHFATNQYATDTQPNMPLCNLSLSF